MSALCSTRSSLATVGRCARPLAVPFTGAFKGSAIRVQLSSITSPMNVQPARRILLAPVCATPEEEKQVVYNKEFGYSRKDIILIGVGLIALGYAMYYGLQAAGMEAGMAGNWVQLTIFMGICVGWVSTYIFRVATKQMTYVKQLEQYEEAVMRKRVEEMTEAELEQLVRETESEKTGKK